MAIDVLAKRLLFSKTLSGSLSEKKMVRVTLEKFNGNKLLQCVLCYR